MFVSAFKQTKRNLRSCASKKRQEKKSNTMFAQWAVVAMNINFGVEKTDKSNKDGYEREREKIHLVCLQLLFSARKNVLVRLWNGFICWLITLWMMQRENKVLEEMCVIVDYTCNSSSLMML